MKAEKAQKFDKEEIRRRLPIEEVCAREGIELRGAGNDLKGLCPFHVERTPSFTVHPDRGRFHCFGCGADGDVFTFWGLRRGLDVGSKEQFGEIVRQLASLCGLAPMTESSSSLHHSSFIIHHSPPPRRAALADKGKPTLPKMRLLRDAEKEQLSRARHGISRAGIDAAEADGRLGFCEWPLDRQGRADSRSLASWVVTDRERWCAQWRSLNGKEYEGRDGHRFKSWSSKNVSWVIGCAEMGGRPAVIVEGGADMLAAYHFLAEMGALDLVAVCCIFGGGVRICPESLAFFAGRQVRIVADNDAPKTKEIKGRPPVQECAGMEAAARWSAQLTEAGALVQVVSLEPLGDAVKDLNDLIKTGYVDVQWREIFEF